MSQYKYSATVNEHRARAVGLLLPISTKQSIEICSLIRKKNLQKAKKILNEVIDMKKPIPFKRFTEGAGHKHGIGPGKYPVKACNEILKLLKLVEANAQHKGLDTSGLEIIHICAKKGPKSWHYGRQSRIAMKRTHVEIVVEEKEVKKKEFKKEIKKVETKKEPVKEEESKLIKKRKEKKEPEKEKEEAKEEEVIKEEPKQEKKKVEELKKKLKEEEKEVKEVVKEEKEVEEKPERSKEIKEKVEIKKEKLKTKTKDVKKAKEELKKEEHKKIEAKVKEIREKLQQEEKSQKEKVPTAFELAKKKENKKTKLIKND